MKNLFTQRNLIIVLVTILGFFGFLVALDYSLKAYNQWKGEQGVENLKKALEKMKEEAYQKMMADTYGGKTPEETLDMFIAALEKGDYGLASKYFVAEKQKEWEENFKIIKNMNKYIQDTKEIKNNFSKGYFANNSSIYTIEKPIYTEFRLYPSGIWKISEI